MLHLDANKHPCKKGKNLRVLKRVLNENDFRRYLTVANDTIEDKEKAASLFISRLSRLLAISNDGL